MAEYIDFYVVVEILNFLRFVIFYFVKEELVINQERLFGNAVTILMDAKHLLQHVQIQGL